MAATSKIANENEDKRVKIFCCWNIQQIKSVRFFRNKLQWRGGRPPWDVLEKGGIYLITPTPASPLIQTRSFHTSPHLQQYGGDGGKPNGGPIFFAKKLLHDVGGGGEEGKTYNLCPSGRPTVKVICSNFWPLTTPSNIIAVLKKHRLNWRIEFQKVWLNKICLISDRKFLSPFPRAQQWLFSGALRRLEEWHQDLSAEHSPHHLQSLHDKIRG